MYNVVFYYGLHLSDIHVLNHDQKTQLLNVLAGTVNEGAPFIFDYVSNGVEVIVLDKPSKITISEASN